MTRRTWIFPVCLALFVTQPAQAQDARRTSLADLVAEALGSNPEIAAAARRHDAMAQRPVQERSLPDPMVSAGYTSIGNPLPGAGLGTEPTARIGFMVSQPIPYPGKLDLKASLAASDADAERQQADAVRQAVVARVKQAYFRLAFTYAVADVLARDDALLELLLGVSEARYAAGRTAQQDVIRAQTQLSMLELQRQRNLRDRATREGELNALLGRPVARPIGQPVDLEWLPFEPSLDALLADAAAHAPMLHRDRAMVDRAQTAIDAAVREYRPDFTVSGGYSYTGAMPPMYEVRLDVTIPLQRARRAASVAEQRSASAAARFTLENSARQLDARIREEFEAVTTASRLAALYRETVLPQARLALDSSLASYQTGSVDFLSVLASVGAVLDNELSYYDELTTIHTAASRLEEMTGTPLVH